MFPVESSPPFLKLSSDHNQPVLAGIGGRGAESSLAAAAHGLDGAVLQRTTRARIEPLHREAAVRSGQIEFGRAAFGQIDQIEFTRLGQAVFRVVVLLVADERVGVLHFPERNPVLAEEIERDAAVIPALVPAAKILADEVVLRELVAEVVFHARAARQEIAPERGLADVVGRLHGLAVLLLAVVTRVAEVGRHTGVGTALFIVGHDPRLASLGRFRDPLERALVGLVPAVLQRRSREQRMIA